MLWIGLGVIGVIIVVCVVTCCMVSKDNKDDFIDFQKYLSESFNMGSTEEDVADDK